jgi:hypothetical protein
MRGSHACVLVGLLLAPASGCRERWLFHPLQRPAAPATELVWSGFDPAALEVAEDGRYGTVRYRLRLVTSAAGVPDLQQIELRFREPLEGAKVDARGEGPRQALTLLQGKRIGGDTVRIALAPLELDRLDVVIHHHRRPLPLVQQVRLGRAPAGRAQP